MKQKFAQLTMVHVCKDMPSYMSHFYSDFDGIVRGTYSQIYGGKNIKNYSIYMLDKKQKKIVNCICWYYEHQLTKLKKQNKKKCEELIESYNFR
jgi:hypothetical protein